MFTNDQSDLVLWRGLCADTDFESRSYLHSQGTGDALLHPVPPIPLMSLQNEDCRAVFEPRQVVAVSASVASSAV